MMCRLSSEDGEHLYQEPLGLADAMFVRGMHLRKIREIVEADERERAEAKLEDELVVTENEVDYLSTGQSVLRYDSYLSHQRYYDDCKHIDHEFIDYGKTEGGNCVIQQQKSLGKGGFCWDAALILAEHLLTTKSLSDKPILELGAGTGLCGILLAKASKCNVEITDMSELLPLMQRNIALNFSNVTQMFSNNDTSSLYQNGIQQGLGSCTARTLDWGARNDGRKYSMIIGADVVNSLYDPIKLAETIHSLCQIDSEVHISCKSRLDEPLKHFETRMRELFGSVQSVKPIGSRNKNPGVYIFQATKPIFSSSR